MTSNEKRLLATRDITSTDAEWPSGLNDLGPHRPPKHLYVRGLPLDVGDHAVAIVGARRPTVAGIEAAEHFARGLAEAGLTIVSGMAIGIDTVAHRAALSAGGYTVGVAGCGLDIDYPRANRRVRDQIAHEGTLVAEHPDGVRPHPKHFPERNRIIAGMCGAVIFVEGTFKSGGLITARVALDANRDVLAVPGSFRNAMAAGPNNLIRSAQASLVTDIQHVFEELAPKLSRSGRLRLAAETPVGLPPPPSLAQDEIEVLALLDDSPVTPDELCDRLAAPFGKIALALSKLEARGLAVKRAMGFEVTRSGASARSSLDLA